MMSLRSSLGISPRELLGVITVTIEGLRRKFTDKLLGGAASLQLVGGL